jgi:hypothetical protein
MVLEIQFVLNATPCRLVNIYRRFEGSWCLHLQGHVTEGKCTHLGLLDTEELSIRIINCHLTRSNVLEGSSITLSLFLMIRHFENSDMALGVISNYVLFAVPFLLASSPVSV